MEISVISTLDGTPQPSLFAPSTGKGPRPLLVILHMWSGDYQQDYLGWYEQAARRGWHVLQPNFRGPNFGPEACASPEARQDILDAVAHVLAYHAVDTHRIYLAGESGGGHMSMVMAAHHPQRWSAVSSWVGLSDLAAWYRESQTRMVRYVNYLEAITGGAPGQSPDIDQQYHQRSPLPFLSKVGDLPIEMNAGIHDGHDGRSVPVSQTLRAFNAIALAQGHPPISEEDIARLLRRECQPLAQSDRFIGLPVYLIRETGTARCVLFEGGHDGLPEAGMRFLESHVRPTMWSTT
jgi:pimeloyl-ACP methyl ester carboxylesterase